MTLHDCVTHYCDDEGASPHENCILSVYDSQFLYSGSGGCTGINSAEMNLYRVTCDYSHRNGGVAGEGGITYKNTMTGVCEDCTVSNTTGPGLLKDASATVTITRLTSGVAQGNTEADSIG